MIRTLLKSKIHPATVTEANIENEGSVTIDRNLLMPRICCPTKGSISGTAPTATVSRPT